MTSINIAAPQSWNTWTKKQWDFFKFEPKGRISTEAFLAAWGVGKTKGVARKFIKRCLENSWNPEYGRAQPMAAMCAPTYKIVQEAMLPKFEEACPPEIIRRKRGLPSPFIELINGCKIYLVSAEASMEGMDLCVFWIDEISDPVFSKNPGKYLNYLARLRDPRSKKMSMLVSGLPLAGWVRETFDFDEDDPDRKTILGGLDDNPFLPQETKANLMTQCPAGWESVLLSGTWGLPLGATFPMFDSSRHIVSEIGDRSRPVHLGIDIGNHGAILVVQERPIETVFVAGRPRTERGLIVVDQILTEFESVEAALYRFKVETEWNVQPGISSICVDPTSRRDEIQAIKKHFPGVRVVVRDRTHELYNVDKGLRLLQASLKDALGNVRIVFSKTLKGKKYGIIEAIEMARGNTGTGQMYIKDDSRDHVVCALRYVACELLRPPSIAPTLVQG